MVSKKITQSSKGSHGCSKRKIRDKRLLLAVNNSSPSFQKLWRFSLHSIHISANGEIFQALCLSPSAAIPTKHHLFYCTWHHPLHSEQVRISHHNLKTNQQWKRRWSTSSFKSLNIQLSKWSVITIHNSFFLIGGSIIFQIHGHNYWDWWLRSSSLGKLSLAVCQGKCVLALS